MTKQQQIAEILNIGEEKVVELALTYLLHLVAMTGSEAHNQWLLRIFL